MRKKFTGRYEHRLITGGIGHNLPQEAPQAFAQAIIDVAKADAAPERQEVAFPTAYTFSTCRYSNSTGVERPKLDMLTFTRPFSSAPALHAFLRPLQRSTVQRPLGLATVGQRSESVASCQGSNSRRVVSSGGDGPDTCRCEHCTMSANSPCLRKGCSPSLTAAGTITRGWQSADRGDTARAKGRASYAFSCSVHQMFRGCTRRGLRLRGAWVTGYPRSEGVSRPPRSHTRRLPV